MAGKGFVRGVQIGGSVFLLGFEEEQRHQTQPFSQYWVLCLTYLSQSYV